MLERERKVLSDLQGLRSLKRRDPRTHEQVLGLVDYVAQLVQARFFAASDKQVGDRAPRDHAAFETLQDLYKLLDQPEPHILHYERLMAASEKVKADAEAANKESKPWLGEVFRPGMSRPRLDKPRKSR